MQEAKHEIYRDCLGFADFSNFNGVRFTYKGICIIAFKLKEAIEVDLLFGFQNLSWETYSIRFAGIWTHANSLDLLLQLYHRAIVFWLGRFFGKRSLS